jgi:hypothetical protein
VGLDVPCALLVSSGVFGLVYGFSNAATHSWHAPSPTNSSSPAWRLAWPRRTRESQPQLSPPARCPAARVGTSLLNTIFASAVASSITAHLTAARLIGRQAPPVRHDPAGRNQHMHGLSAEDRFRGAPVARITLMR